MMTSEQMSVLPSLLDYINSDLFTLENISSSVKLSKLKEDSSILVKETNTVWVQYHDNEGMKQYRRASEEEAVASWLAVIDYLPLKFYKMIESYQDMYHIEKFDDKYRCNPKRYAYDKYESTNMWRPIMILNRCPSITKFRFEWIRYYDIHQFSNLLSVLISRVTNNGS